MRHLIIEALHKVAQKQGVINVPQDYSKEFGQTGSGKAIFGAPQRLSASKEDIDKTIQRINDSIEVSKAYRNAYINGTPDETGNVPFRVMYQGRIYDAKIPPQFFFDETAGGQKTDYAYYFNVPEMGDGAMQVKYNKRGYGEVSVLRSKTDIPFAPDLGSAADAGYSKDYEGRHKYVTVKVGVRGKYQGESKFYSVFPSPAMDAKIKADIGFRNEILDFMKGGGDYTSDEKGKEISNKMEVSKKIEKIRKDAENIIGKPISSNKDWIEFKNYLIKAYGKPDAIFNMDTDKELKSFLEKYKTTNIFKPIGKPEMSLPKDELEAWEKEQKEKMARIAAARARMKK